jgi:acetyl-CoA acetyltransferase
MCSETGAGLATTLLHGLGRRPIGQVGVATMCAAGGQARVQVVGRLVQEALTDRAVQT